MADKFLDFIENIKTNKEKSAICAVAFFLLLIVLISFLDIGLAVGLLLLVFLSSVTFIILLKSGYRDKKLYLLFAISLLVHLSVTLFIYYANFRPFGGGGDFDMYQKDSIELAHRFAVGNFSLAGTYSEHYFSPMLAIIYVFTLPHTLVGLSFITFLATLSVLLAYLIILEIGGSEKTAFIIGLIVAIYPSYLYFGSVLLKDTVIIPLVLAGMLLFIKMIKNFSWLRFLIFFAILTPLINLRFYIGYALMFSFIICWFLISNFGFKRRVVYGALIVFLLGFSPYLLGNGYYGSNSFIKFLNPKSVTYFREVVYNTPISKEPVLPAETPSAPTPSAPTPSVEDRSGNGSTFVVETGFKKGVFSFAENYLKSFTYSLLGPFPWQFRYQRQIVGLAETIPWYLLIIVSFYGFINFIRRKGISEFLKFHKFCLPLLLFGLFALGALSLFINNYGIIARIRIPVFICFLSIMFISFNNDIENYSKIFYEKIFSHWRSRFYRL